MERKKSNRNPVYRWWKNRSNHCEKSHCILNYSPVIRNLLKNTQVLYFGVAIIYEPLPKCHIVIAINYECNQFIAKNLAFIANNLKQTHRVVSLF